jgi:hypothetical protein
LLSVHSHSHGGQIFGASKRAQRKRRRAILAQAGSLADLVSRVCRLHGLNRSPQFKRFSLNRMFLPCYQNFHPFSSEIVIKCPPALSRFMCGVVDFFAHAIYNETNAPHKRQTRARASPSRGGEKPPPVFHTNRLF